MSDGNQALKYDKDADYGEKLPWDLLPVESVEGKLRVLHYGQRKYTTCRDCGAKVYPNPRLDGDKERDDCPECGSKNIETGAHNWRKGFKWTRLIAAAFRHLKAILQGEDCDNGPGGSGLPHVDHLACMVAFLSSHQKLGYGEDDRHTTLAFKLSNNDASDRNHTDDVSVGFRCDTCGLLSSSGCYTGRDSSGWICMDCYEPRKSS